MEDVSDLDDADRVDGEEAAPADPVGELLAAPETAPGWVSRRTLEVVLTFAGLVALIGIAFFSIATARKPGAPTPAPAVLAPAPSASATAAETASAAAFVEPSLLKAAPAEQNAVMPQNTSPKKRRASHAGPGTVSDAAARSCSTSSVDGLSRQIIVQARCTDPKAFVAVPARRNLEIGPSVFLYLDQPAREHLLKALDANKNKTMTVHSALRTVAQQYLLRRWATSRRCGIEIATPPGESNHETGLALDISEPGSWRAALAQQGFHWLGSIDRVHFDYAGPDAASHSSVDVRAFQRLWNANHPDDRITENGRYGPETEDRLEKSPAKGFPHGPHCAR